MRYLSFEREHVLLALPNNIAHGIVFADNVLAPPSRAAVFVSTTNLGRRLPHHLGEVIIGVVDVVVVCFSFVVPCLNGRGPTRVSSSQILSVLTVCVGKNARTIVVVGVVFSVLVWSTGPR